VPISGLVISCRDASEAQGVAESIRSDLRLEVGAPESNRLPAVIDAECEDEMREIHNRILETAGVEFIDVVCVHFEDDHIEHTKRNAG